MIRSIELCFTHAMRLGGKRTFRFERGVNVVIGPNGSGKSTLLRALHECGECRRERDDGAEIHYFNSESMNPHNRSEPDRSPLGMLLRTRGMFSSHGQIMKAAMVSLPVREGGVLLIDEPEAGQDLAGVRRLVAGFEMLAKRNVQVIVATHHPLFFNGGTLIELDPGYAARVNRELCAALGCKAPRHEPKT
jgi:predicted ATPase